MNQEFEMKPFLAAAMALAVASPALADPSGNMPGMAGGQMAAAASMTTADGAGVVKAVDARKGTVTIQHGPIAGLNWPAMTMAFKASPPALLQGVTVGESVKFKLMKMAGGVQLTAIQPK
jgi:Cu(I)/Ag(I) efflux system protein CusF